MTQNSLIAWQGDRCLHREDKIVMGYANSVLSTLWKHKCKKTGWVEGEEQRCVLLVKTDINRMLMKIGWRKSSSEMLTWSKTWSKLSNINSVFDWSFILVFFWIIFNNFTTFEKIPVIGHQWVLTVTGRQVMQQIMQEWMLLFILFYHEETRI